MSVTAPPRAAARPRRRGASRPKPWWFTFLLGLPVPILFVVFWHYGRQHEWELVFGIRMGHLPYPKDVVLTFVDFAVGGIRDDAFSGELWTHLKASAARIGVGFALASAVAIPLGLLMGRYYAVNSLFDVIINLFRPIPATAWVPLVALLIGYGDQATIFLITLSAFFPIVLGTISGARQTPPRLIEAARMLGTRQVETLWKVVLPAAMPAIVNGLRVGLGLAWVVLVLGESVGVRTGLGSTILLARDLVRTDLIVVGMACIGLAGFLSDRLLVGLLKLVFRGRPLMG